MAFGLYHLNPESWLSAFTGKRFDYMSSPNFIFLQLFRLHELHAYQRLIADNALAIKKLQIPTRLNPEIVGGSKAWQELCTMPCKQTM